MHNLAFQMKSFCHLQMTKFFCRFVFHTTEKDPGTTQPPKTYNERTLEEEQKLLEEKQKKLKTEHDTNVKIVEKEYQKCMSKTNISYNEQQDCYTRKHQNLNDLNARYKEDFEEAENHFKQQTDFRCSICLEKLDCKVVW